MKKIVLIACVKRKLGRPAKAKDLYISDLFKKSLKYAYLLMPDKIFILSAKYHLVELEKTIEPYELTLKKMSSGERRNWANKVLNDLCKVADLNSDEIIFLAGIPYRQFLEPHMYNCSIPMKGLRFGEQLNFLKSHIHE